MASIRFRVIVVKVLVRADEAETAVAGLSDAAVTVGLTDPVVKTRKLTDNDREDFDVDAVIKDMESGNDEFIP